MSTINKAMLIGYIAQDPDIRTLSNNSKVLTFLLATSELVKTGNTIKGHTEWHHIIMWNQLTEAASRVLTKGKMVYIQCQIKTRSFLDQAGVKRYITEIVALEFNLLS